MKRGQRRQSRKRKKSRKTTARTAPQRPDLASGELFQSAVDHHKAGELPAAEELYRQILEADPEHIGCLYYLSRIAKESGDLPLAEQLINKVLLLNPGFAKAHNSLGIILKSQERLDGALASFERALSLEPGYAIAQVNLSQTCKKLGEAFLKLGRLGEARARFEQALAGNPDFAEAHNSLGIALYEQGQVDEALARFERAISLRPDFAEAHNNLGNILQKLRRMNEAAASFERALSLKPDLADAHGNLGNILQEQGRLDEALSCYQRALSLNPDYAEAHNNLAAALLETGQLEKAITSCRTALSLAPDFAKAHNNLGNIFLHMRKADESHAAYRRALEIMPQYIDAHSNLIFALDFDPQTSDGDRQAERRLWDEIHARPLARERRARANDPEPGKRLRIGYVSADFRRHSAASVFGPVLFEHDRSRFEVICYSNSLHEDDLTARFQGAVSGWRSIAGMPDEAAAQAIVDDGIDILVDLSGHSKGNRLLVFARKPAPIQVTAWGHATGTGLEAMDYLFSDPIFMPAGDRTKSREEVVDLPCALGFLCPPDAPPVEPLPAKGRGQVTFGCFNKMHKVSNEALDTWCEILARIADSEIILKDKSLDAEDQRQYVINEFQRRDVAPQRIRLLGRTPWRQHMAAYSLVDIGLDPFPHSGGTTTLEGLWMGVPFVTLKGRTLNSRGTASIQAAIGLTGWTAETPEGYLEIAQSKARDLGELARLRGSLRQRLATSPIGDASVYVGAVEKAYRSMWRHWCNSR